MAQLYCITKKPCNHWLILKNYIGLLLISIHSHFQAQLQGLDKHVGGLLRHLPLGHRHLLLLLLRLALRRRQLRERRQPIFPQSGKKRLIKITFSPCLCEPLQSFNQVFEYDSSNNILIKMILKSWKIHPEKPDVRRVFHRILLSKRVHPNQNSSLRFLLLFLAIRFSNSTKNGLKVSSDDTKIFITIPIRYDTELVT